MELGPIFRALVCNKARFWLITIEVALTLAIVVNCINMLLDLRSGYVQSTGIDESHIIGVEIEPYGRAYGNEVFVEDLLDRDVEALRAIPGVRNAAATSAIPLSGSGSATGRRPEGSELDGNTAPYFVVGDGFADALGTAIVIGRNFIEEDFAFARDENGDIVHRNALVTQALADRLFPDGDAVGKVIQDAAGSVKNTIVGVTDQLPNSWPEWQSGRDWTMLLPGAPGDARNMRYVIGVEPDAIDHVFSEVETTLLATDGDRLITVQTLADTKRGSFNGAIGLIKLLTSVIVLLIGVTGLGIVGLTAFSVTQRTREIGTRRALGATKTDIVRYFLVENGVVTTIGLTIGIGLTYALNLALVNLADAPRMPWTLVITGMAMLWATGFLAAIAPAWRASRVPPEVATRTV